MALLRGPDHIEPGTPLGARPGAGPTALHLARLLVAVAEQHAIAAEHAANGDPADVDVATYQTTYDRAAVGGGLERLTLASWRAQRLAASGKALCVDLTRADTDTEDEGEGEGEGEPSARAAVWGLTASAATAVEGLLALLGAGGETPPGYSTFRRVASADAAPLLTRLLIRP